MRGRGIAFMSHSCLAIVLSGSGFWRNSGTGSSVEVEEQFLGYDLRKFA